MRRMIAVAAAAALVGTAAVAPTSAPAASAAAAPIAAPGPLQPAQFYGAGPQWGDDGWERRRQWR
jgi:Spy/CpxP family protein refolding chaperone